MMEKAMERAKRIAEARKAAVVKSVADELRNHAPSATVETTGDDVSVIGRGLLKQWLDSANLRFFADNLR